MVKRILSSIRLLYPQNTKQFWVIIITFDLSLKDGMTASRVVQSEAICFFFPVGCPGNQSPSSTSRTTSQNAKFSIHKDPSNLLPFKRPFSKTKSSPDQSLSMQSQQEKGTLPQQSSMSKPSAKAGNLQRSIYKKPLSLKSDKQKAIEAANLFREIERFSEIEKNGQEASISEPDNEIDSAVSLSSHLALANPNSLIEIWKGNLFLPSC